MSREPGKHDLANIQPVWGCHKASAGASYELYYCRKLRKCKRNKCLSKEQRNKQGSVDTIKYGSKNWLRVTRLQRWNQGIKGSETDIWYNKGNSECTCPKLCAAFCCTKIVCWEYKISIYYKESIGRERREQIQINNNRWWYYH